MSEPEQVPEREIVGWELIYTLWDVSQDEAEALFDKAHDEIFCNCDGREDGPPCRMPIAIIHPIYEDDDE